MFVNQMRWGVAMITYHDVDEWTRWDGLIQNRVSIANQILGARYDGDMSNPVQVRTKRGERYATICGEVFVSWKPYDLDSVVRAFGYVDALSDSLWLLRRGKAITICGDFNQR